MGRLVRDAADELSPDVMHLVSMYCWYRDERVPAVIDLLDVVSGLCDAAAAARPVRYGLAHIQRMTSERAERRELARMARSSPSTVRMRRACDGSASSPPWCPWPFRAVRGGDAVTGRTGAASEVEGAAATRPRRQLPAPSQSCRRGLHQRSARAATQGRRHAVHLDHRGTRRAPRARRLARAAVVEYIEDVPDLTPLYCAADIVLVPVALAAGRRTRRWRRWHGQAGDRHATGLQRRRGEQR